MFDLGFSELLIVAVVALIVLGPERLPKATRFAGLWVRRARNQWASVKDELERDLASEDLKNAMKEARDAVRDTEQSVRASADEAREEFQQMRTAVASDSMADGAVPAEAHAGETQAEESEEAGEGPLASSSELVYEEDLIDETHDGPAPDSGREQDHDQDQVPGHPPEPDAVAPDVKADADAEPGPEDERRNS